MFFGSLANAKLKGSANSNMIKPEKFDHIHLVYHFTVPLRFSDVFRGYRKWNIGKYFNIFPSCKCLFNNINENILTQYTCVV